MCNLLNSNQNLFKRILEAARHKTAAVRHLPSILQTLQERRLRHAEHCWRSKDELISNVCLWTPIHGRTSVSWPSKTYSHQLCSEIGWLMLQEHNISLWRHIACLLKVHVHARYIRIYTFPTFRGSPRGEYFFGVQISLLVHRGQVSKC